MQEEIIKNAKKFAMQNYNGDRYAEKILSILSALVWDVIGAGIVAKRMLNKRQEIQEMSDKHFALFLMINQWVKVKQEGKFLAKYFRRTGYKNIAVYGMSYVGETFVNESKKTDIKISYGIDKKAGSIYENINVVSLYDELKNVDIIVVTAVTFFDEIKENLLERVDCPIISLGDILYDI